MKTKENKTMNHTPTPWKFEKMSDGSGIYTLDDELIASEVANADAEIIVSAVNAHEDLVKALHIAIQDLSPGVARKECQEALAKAGGKA